MSLSQRIREVSKAVSITKDASGYNYKYAKLDQIRAKLLEEMPNHNLDYRYGASVYPDAGVQEYSITIYSTDSDTSSPYTLSLGYPVTDDAQAQGSIQTYARRYLLLMVFDLVPEEDDDGAISKSRSKSNKAASSARRQRRS